MAIGQASLPLDEWPPSIGRGGPDGGLGPVEFGSGPSFHSIAVDVIMALEFLRAISVTLT